MTELNKKQREILFELLKDWTQNLWIVCDDDFECFNTDENVNQIVSDIDKELSKHN
jgi:hypothetical protein